MGDSMSWRGLYDHCKAQAAIFAERVRHAKNRIKDAKARRDFVGALTFKMDADQYRQAKIEYINKAAEIKRLHL